MTTALNILVAERVMEWTDFWQHDGWVMGYSPNEQEMGIEGERQLVPEYSEDVAAAFQVVEKMIGDGFIFKSDAISGDFTVEFYCSRGPCEKHGNKSTVMGHGASANAETMALAIILAALRAVGTSEDEIQRAMEEGQ